MDPQGPLRVPEMGMGELAVTGERELWDPRVLLVAPSSGALDWTSLAGTELRLGFLTHLTAPST